MCSYKEKHINHRKKKTKQKKTIKFSKIDQKNKNSNYRLRLTKSFDFIESF